MQTSREDRKLPGPVTLVTQTQTWVQDANGNPYIGTALVTQDPGQTYQAQKKTEQTLDVWGNLTQLKLYDINSLTTPLRTYTNTYLGTSSYTSRNIRNRLLTSAVSDGTNSVTLVTNTYDSAELGCSYPVTPALSPAPSLWDSAVTQYRGNVTRSVSLAGTTYGCFDETGTAKTSQAVTGTQTNVQTSSNSAYAVPTAITQGSLSETMNWNSFLGMTGATNPNGATTSVSYDSATRPSVVTNPHGGSTTYTYTNSPPTVTATINTTGDGNGRWTRTTLDGLGRTIKVETGYSTVTKSIAETEYDSCACSPVGKLKRSTMPYAPGTCGTKVFFLLKRRAIGFSLGEP